MRLPAACDCVERRGRRINRVDQTAWGTPPPDKVIAHTNLDWRYHAAPGRTAAVSDTKDVTFVARARSSGAGAW